MSQRIDKAWRNANPLPKHGVGTDKNSRGRVLIAGGSEFVPGALRLTAEAALRAGAGKAQIATVRSVAMALGVLIPEAAMIGLPFDEDGEIAVDAVDTLKASLGRCDTMVFGPGMLGRGSVAVLLKGLLDEPETGRGIVLDAAAIAGACDLAALTKAHGGRVVMTPHYGEMAALTGLDIEKIEADPEAVARDVAQQFGALVVLKSSATVVVAPDGAVMHYSSDCTGLATGGSGDVLAGIIGGLMAQGAEPLTAAAWGVWLHGEAGGRVEKTIGPLGFLARDLLIEIPKLMAQ